MSALVQDEAVVAIHGPRSVGKSTLLRKFADAQHAEVIDLDNLVVRDAIAASPSAIIDAATPICIDEYQHVPEVLDALKAKLNKEGVRPGVAVITGSTRQDTLPKIAQALTGRVHNFNMLPLSQGEIAGVHENILAALHTNPDAVISMYPQSNVTREQYAQRITTGGFPLALARRSDASRSRWFGSYIQTSLERDAAQLAAVGLPRALSEVFKLLAAHTAQLVNIHKLTKTLGIDRGTVETYTRLLEDLFLVYRLPAWGKTLHSRATSSPKFHMIDTGIAAHLLRINAAKLASLDPTVLTEFGYLLETFAVMELRKQTTWLDEPVTIGHWRTSDGDEVDFVIEFADGSVLAFEVKAGERVSTADFSGLRKLRNILGERFIAGITLNLGPYAYTQEDRLHVLPLSGLWHMHHP